MFGHRLHGESHRNQWARLADVVDSLENLSELERRVLKAVAVLNLLDVENLLATEQTLTASLGDTGEAVSAAIGTLRRRGALFDRGAAGGYCLWPNTSINLDAAYESARRAVGADLKVAENLVPHMDSTPLLARRHAIETGTLRHFELRYTDLPNMKMAVNGPTDADGVVLVVLADARGDRAKAEEAARPYADRPDLIVGISQPLAGLTRELHELKYWEWVAANTPELAQDQYAYTEMSRQLALAQRRLETRAASLIGVRGAGPDAGTSWWRSGRRLQVPPDRGLVAALSEICRDLYGSAPVINNELLNRRSISSAAAAARMRLIERMFTSASQPSLGFEADQAPPEKLMYLSVLDRGRVHCDDAGTPTLALPGEDDPPQPAPGAERGLGPPTRPRGPEGACP